MRLLALRSCIQIMPESKIDEAYLEEVSGLRNEGDFIKCFDWVIVGFQTNPFKKIEKKAITDIIEVTRENKISLFLKDSIYKAYPELPIMKEFPERR